MNILFGDRLRMLRENKDMTQKELGKLLNISDRVIGYYESNDRFPKDADVLKKISEIFNCSVDYLIGRTDDPDTKIIVKEDLPKELVDAGIEGLEILKDLKVSDLTSEELQELLDFANKVKNRKED